MKVATDDPTEPWAGFFARYRAFREERADHALGRLHTGFERMRPALEDLRRQEQVRDRAEARRFNVFEVLGLERREVRLHSALIGHLLDPHGKHGQGLRFLEAFLRMAHDRGLRLPEPLPGTGWRTETERPAGRYGRLDIVVAHPASGFLLALENKVDAGLAPGQLGRYRAWLDARQRLPEDLHQLVFLTPAGQQGTGEEDVCLSYHVDLAGWLRTVAAGLPPRLRETLDQYRQLALSLTDEAPDEPDQPADR